MPQKQRAGSREKLECLAEVQEVAEGVEIRGWQCHQPWVGQCCGGDAAVTSWQFWPAPQGIAAGCWPCVVTGPGVTRGSATKLLTVALAHRGCCPCFSAANYVSERFPFDANHPGKAWKTSLRRARLHAQSVPSWVMGWGWSSEPQHICPAVPGAPAPAQCCGMIFNYQNPPL